jgi:hypothetical protein
MFQQVATSAEDVDPKVAGPQRARNRFGGRCLHPSADGPRILAYETVMCPMGSSAGPRWSRCAAAGFV